MVPDLKELEGEFTVREIELAVKGLGKNKALGPDGLPSEFLQLHWKELKIQVVQIIMKLICNTF